MSLHELRLLSSKLCSVSGRRFEPARAPQPCKHLAPRCAPLHATPQHSPSKESPSSGSPQPWIANLQPAAPPRQTAHDPRPTEAQVPLPAAFSEKYLLRRMLGRGSFGTVCSVIDKHTGLEWAAKIMPKKLEGKDPQRILTRIQEEVDILRSLQKRPETLRLHEVIEDEETLCILTEVCYGGDMEQLLRQRGHLQEAEAAQVLHAALRVLEQCHKEGVCYGDVKPANFLLKWPFPSIADPCAPPDIRVADFGCAQAIVPGAQKKPGGTPLYVAPEQFMQTVGLESDMWSLGMLFFQLLCGRLPFADSFKGKSPMDVMMAILSEDVKFEGPQWENVSEGARSLVLRMLDRDYNTRVKPGDALLDPWLLSHTTLRGDNEALMLDHTPRNSTAGF